jgi:hypothetical protein
VIGRLIKLIAKRHDRHIVLDEPTPHDNEQAIIAYLNDETIDAADYGRGVAGF